MTESHTLVNTRSNDFFTDNTEMTKQTRTFWDRLVEAMNDKGMDGGNTTAAANLIGKHQTAATKWKQGGYPSMTSTTKLAGKLGVCVEWLLTGNGDKHPTSKLPDGLSDLAALWPMLDQATRDGILSAARGSAYLARATAYTGPPERRTAIHEPIERYQAKNHKKPPSKPVIRHKANPKK